MVGNLKNKYNCAICAAGGMSQCRRKRGEMRDKENRKGARKATKPSDTVKALAPTQAKVPLTPSNTSRVRRVPDFNKLHKSFQLQMEKAKKNKQLTEFKTFDLTPVVKPSVKYNSSGKGVKEHQETVRKEVEERRENSSEEDEDKRTRETTVDFEPRPDCLQAILNNNQPVVEPAPQTPNDVGPLKRGQSMVMGVALPPGQQIRLSVYTKRDRTLRKLLQSKASDGAGVVSAGGSCPRPSEFRQLLQDMVQGTATTLRTVSRLARGEGTTGEEVELEGVKLRLESQLEEAAEETMASRSQPNTRLCHTLTPLTKPHPLPDTPTGHTTSVTHPLDHQLSLPLCKPSFYHEDPELKAMVWRTAVCRSPSHHSEGEKRPTCPLARLLDQCYIISLTDVTSNTKNT